MKVRFSIADKPHLEKIMKAKTKKPERQKPPLNGEFWDT
jgi:hypothetical protein